jgi:hypothetical protein
MLSDGLTERQSETGTREEVEVVDVAQMLLAAVRPHPANLGTVRPIPDKPRDPAPATP